MLIRVGVWRLTLGIALLTAAIAEVVACTGIQLRPGDGSIIYARTLEFGMDLKSSILVVPRGLAFTGSAPGGKPGLNWKAKYGAVGTNAFQYKVYVDGLNEKGLAVGLFYFPGFAKYQKVTPAEESKTLAPHELAAYLLTTCASVDETINAVRQVKVGDVVLKEFGFVPPAHYVVHDASGKCVVLEYVEGELHIHDNPLGVMSNAPTFDWHMTNLRNFVNLRYTSVPPLKIDGVEFPSFGQGSGMLGLPGDFTPPSRLVRAVAFTHSAVPVATAEEGMKQAFKILNLFDIPKGASRETELGHEVAEYTLWTSAADLKNLNYCFRTFENSRIRIVHLSKCDLEAPTARFISMAGEEVFEDVIAAKR